jgi:hypothetical protein
MVSVMYYGGNKMHIDNAARESEGSHPDPPALQFVSFEVGPTANGGLRVSLASTFLDEANLEFLAEDIETVVAANIEEAISVIRRSLMDALHAHVGKEHCSQPIAALRSSNGKARMTIGCLSAEPGATAKNPATDLILSCRRCLCQTRTASVRSCSGPRRMTEKLTTVREQNKRCGRRTIVDMAGAAEKFAHLLYNKAGH